MSWTEVSISVARQAAGGVEQALEQLGALAVTLEDDEDNPVLEPDPGATPLWPSVQIRGLFESDVDRGPIVSLLQEFFGSGRPDRIRWRDVENQDWERAWMDRFEPMQFGQRLWIVPGGMKIPFVPGNIEIRLDPGLAFGTGTHPTTALCLEWLDGQDFTASTVVDYGCGSGILGIAAALKGAGRVICVDNDPQALEAAADNAGRNGVSGLIECLLPRDFRPPSADAVLANILAAPLVRLKPLLLESLAPGGALVLSGILEEQAAAVEAVYRHGLTSVETKSMDGWVRLSGNKS